MLEAPAVTAPKDAKAIVNERITAMIFVNLLFFMFKSPFLLPENRQ
jgi:hypothetical protein